MTQTQPCRSGHTDCTVDCGWCKGTGVMPPRRVTQTQRAVVDLILDQVMHTNASLVLRQHPDSRVRAAVDLWEEADQ